MVKIIIFDIDNTLTESRSKISSQMVGLLVRLLKQSSVALISGGSLDDFEQQVVSSIPYEYRKNLYLLPTSGAELCVWENNAWKKEYSFQIGAHKKRLIIEQVAKTMHLSPVTIGHFIYDRGSQITFTGLGKDASLEDKYAWDPTHEKRRAIISSLKPLIHGISMTIGGSTSIDFTEEGIDKSFGVQKILQHLHINAEDAVFVGDALSAGGNDEPVKKLGLKSIETSGPKQTEIVIQTLLTEKTYVKSVAFFCSEYALGGDERMYAGGLGVLAADLLYEAGDQNMPFIAVGMKYADTHPDTLGFTCLTTSGTTQSLLVEIPFEKRIIRVQVWHKCFGENASLYLLDPDITENIAEDRIAGKLYDPHFYTRLRQQIIMGIGGFRLFKALGIEPKVYHLNEGNMAFAALAILVEGFTSLSLDHDSLVKAVRGKIVATKHTILPAGTDIPFDDLWRFIGDYCEKQGIDKAFIMSLGAHEDDPDMFTATKFLLNLAGKANAVSAIHASCEKEKYPASSLMAITNGVYQKRWQSASIGKKENGSTLSDQELWKAKSVLRQELIDEVKRISGAVLDPNICTIVWTRRFVSYKRPLLIFDNPDRLKALLTDPRKPLQIIFSGKVYEGDAESKEIEEKIRAFCSDSAYQGRIVYVPGYSITFAQKLVQGADIWLNTPIRGKEACGTSGMKAGLNGALQMSVSDGWVDEVDWKGIGWVLSHHTTSQSLYDSLAEVGPLFSTRSKEGVPVEWIRMMRDTINIVESRYTASRALRDYKHMLYGM